MTVNLIQADGDFREQVLQEAQKIEDIATVLQAVIDSLLDPLTGKLN
jgi:hypothetical protein